MKRHTEENTKWKRYEQGQKLHIYFKTTWHDTWEHMVCKELKEEFGHKRNAHNVPLTAVAVKQLDGVGSARALHWG